MDSHGMAKELRKPKYSFSTKRTLGSGAFATVFLGTRRLEGEDSIKIAVKRICKSKMQSKPKMQRLLRTEVAVLRELRGSAHIVHLYDCFEDADYMHLVLEYCDGGDLSDYAKKHAPLTEAVMHDLLSQLSRAIQKMRQHHITHRDIKPQNVLLKKDAGNRVSGFCVKLSDFGFATKLGNQDLTATYCGSPLHMAPEVLGGSSYDSKIDLWSFGTVAYQLATGTTPFRATSVKDLQQKLKQAQLKRQKLPMPPHVSDNFRDFVQALLCPLPKQRLDFDAFYAHPWFHSQHTVAIAPASFEDVATEVGGPLVDASDAILDRSDTSFVIVDKFCTDITLKLERMRAVPTSCTEADAVVQTGLRELIASVLAQTALIIQIADRQPLWDRMLLYGKALLLLRDSSKKAIEFIDALAHQRTFAETVAAVRKYQNCMSHCLGTVDGMRQRIGRLNNGGDAEHRISPEEVLFEAALQFSRRAQRHDDRAHRTVAIVLYKATLDTLMIAQRFAECEDLSAQIATSIATITRRLHIVTSNSYSQIGTATMMDDSQCISSGLRRSAGPPASAPIDIPMEGVRRVRTTSSAADSLGRARYCASCGMKYGTASENFCAMCGLQRTLITSSCTGSGEKNTL